MDIKHLDKARAALAADIAEAEARKGPTLNAEGRYCARRAAISRMAASLRAIDAAAEHVAGLPDLIPLPTIGEAKKSKKGTKR